MLFFNLLKIRKIEITLKFNENNLFSNKILRSKKFSVLTTRELAFENFGLIYSRHLCVNSTLLYLSNRTTKRNFQSSRFILLVV